MASLLADLLRPKAANEVVYPWSTLPLDIGPGRRQQLEDQRRAVKVEGSYSERDYQRAQRGEVPKLFEEHSAAGDGKVIAKTARATGLCRRVVESLVALTLGESENLPQPVTGRPGEDDEVEKEARALLEESDAALWINTAMRNAGQDGDSFIDVVRHEDGDIEVQVWPASQVMPIYSPSSWTRMERALCIGRDEGVVGEEGTPTYWRFMDKETVAWGTSMSTMPGAPQKQVANTLGVVPLVHLRALWDQRCPYGEWLAGGILNRQMMLDSMQSQRLALIQNTADPKYLVRGRVGQGEWSVAGHGKVIFTGNSPEDVMVEFLEVRGNVIQYANEAIRDAEAAAAKEEPALAVSAPGANTSGVAWKIRTLGLSGVVGQLRRHLSRTIAEVLGRYRALKRNEPYDRAWVRSLHFRFDSDPNSNAAQLQALPQLLEAGIITQREARAYLRQDGLLLQGFPIDPTEEQG